MLQAKFSSLRRIRALSFSTPSIEHDSAFTMQFSFVIMTYYDSENCKPDALTISPVSAFHAGRLKFL